MDMTHAAEITVKASMILALAWVATRALRRRSASLRHLVWALALFGTLALPVLELSLPKVELERPARLEEAPLQPQLVDQTPTPSLFVAKPTHLESPPGSVTHPVGESLTAMAATRAIPISAIAFAIWLVIFSALVLYWLKRLISMQQVDRKPLSETLFPSVPSLKREVAFFVSCQSVPAIPLTWGLFRPKILLPKVAESWPPNHIEVVLAHEMAHVRRCDSLWQGIAFLACALYWLNPAMWLAARAMRAEAEHAADDSVLRLGVSPSDYASTLVTVAAAASGRHLQSPLAGVAFMNPNKLEKRIDAILDPARSRRGSVAMVALVAPSALAAIFLLAALGLGGNTRKMAVPPAGQPLQQNPAFEVSTQNAKSSWWKIVLTQNASKTLIFVYQKGNDLMGYESTKSGGSASSSGRGGSTTALDTWKIDHYQNLSDGNPIEPFRVIKPEYRKLLAQNGILVTASTAAEAKSNFDMGVPPDADEEKAKFIQRHYGKNAEQISGPAVFYKGNVIGIVRTSVRKEAQVKGWHWPAITDSTGAAQPTGYWKVAFPAPAMPRIYMFHKVGNSVEMTSLEASFRPAQPVNGKRPVIDGMGQSVEAWSLKTETQTWSGGGELGVNGITLRPQYLDDPAYRERIKSSGVRIEPTTSAEEAEFTRVRFTPLLERDLAAAENDSVEEQAQAMLHPHFVDFKTTSTRPPGIHGEIVVGGHRMDTWMMDQHSLNQAPFDAKAAAGLMAAADAELEALAKDWANASVAVDLEKAKAGSGGSQALFEAEDHLQEVRQKITGMTMTYGRSPNSSLFSLPQGSADFFRVQADKLSVSRQELDRKSDEAEALFAQHKISEYDKELAEDLAAIERFKERSLERGVRSASQRASNSPFFGSETQQRINRLEFASVTLDAKDEDVRPLLEKLFHEQGVELVLDPAVHGLVTISAKTAPGGSVLREILKLVGAKSYVDDGTYHIVPGP